MALFSQNTDAILHLRILMFCKFTKLCFFFKDNWAPSEFASELLSKLSAGQRNGIFVFFDIFVERGTQVQVDQQHPDEGLGISFLSTKACNMYTRR